VCGPFWILLWAVLDITKIYGPFLSGPFWFMGRFGIDPCGQLYNKMIVLLPADLPSLTKPSYSYSISQLNDTSATAARSNKPCLNLSNDLLHAS